MRKDINQPDQPCVACVAPESGFQHICPNNPILTCNCSNPNECPCIGSDPDGDQSRNEDRCPNHDGFADNIEYTHIEGIPYPKREAKHTGWPCVVVGAVCETWTNPAEFVSDSSFSSASTGGDADAGHSDGPYVSTNH